MGWNMSARLAKAGFNVTVYNRNPTKAEAWIAEHGGTLAHTPAEAAEGAGLVLSCVGADDDVIEITVGPNGAFSTMPTGSIFIDHTTISPTTVQSLAVDAANAGIEFLDAPVSGGPKGAINGILTIMLGGPKAAIETARPALESYGAEIRRMGNVGAGQSTKVISQICVAGLLQSLCEGMYMAERSGLDIDEVVSILSKGAAGSWMMNNQSATIKAGTYDHGFAVDWMRKDLGICLSEARKLKVDLPVTALVDQFLGDVQDIGGGRWDISSLMARLRHFDSSKAIDL